MPFKLVYDEDSTEGSGEGGEGGKEKEGQTETLLYAVSSTSGRVVAYKREDKVKQFKAVKALLNQIQEGGYNTGEEVTPVHVPSKPKLGLVSTGIASWKATRYPGSLSACYPDSPPTLGFNSRMGPTLFPLSSFLRRPWDGALSASEHITHSDDWSEEGLPSARFVWQNVFRVQKLTPTAGHVTPHLKYPAGMLESLSTRLLNDSFACSTYSMLKRSARKTELRMEGSMEGRCDQARCAREARSIASILLSTLQPIRSNDGYYWISLSLFSRSDRRWRRTSCVLPQPRSYSTILALRLTARLSSHRKDAGKQRMIIWRAVAISVDIVLGSMSHSGSGKG
ncbi:hypothetical protein NMY22_g2961 [Coprinellus aureogranulatus]|nr:hypothetical protein NMY22_g2961 [Coprinellus aureogranulatus]